MSLAAALDRYKENRAFFRGDSHENLEIMTIPESITLTPQRERLLQLLKDGKWHRKFLGIGKTTFDSMWRWGLLEWAYVSKNPEKSNNYAVKAQITAKGKYLLKHGSVSNTHWPKLPA